MIKTISITLRLFQSAEDVRTTMALYNDLNLRGELDHTEVYPPGSILQQFQENGLWTRERGKMLITDAEDRILGDIGFSKLNEFELEVGYRMLSQTDRGKGVMTKALKLFTAYLFNCKPVLRIRLQTAADNIPSRKLAEKCGYVQEGVIRQGYFYRGRQVDSVIYGILREEAEDFSALLKEMNE